jgi:hypothetical protein
MTYRPPQCTEREPDGSWEDCTWASGIDLGNAAYGSTKYPPTQAEYEALRKASGDSMTGGSNLRDLMNGMMNRWGWTGGLLIRPTFSQVWSSLKPGTGMALQGSMGPAALLHYRRWDTNFRGGHCVYVQRESNDDRVFWMNPQAPTTYAGEWMDKATLATYFNGLSGAEAMHVAIGSRKPLPDTDTETNMAQINDTDTSPAPKLVDLGIGVQIYALANPPEPKVKVASGGTGIYSPFASGNYRAVVFSVGGVRQLGLVQTADCKNIRPLATDCTAAVTAEHARVKAAAIASAEAL